ncbi:MAG: NAD-dependent epimerase/dehydratase family protein [Deltaproteobacteria bacterium]|nr:NAD-dependent epimerase/dehydratase family protein [Deltaproteobacteria bacterium]
MKFFITGATGFIGQHLCRDLIKHGHEVAALVRSHKKAASLKHDRLEIIYGDLDSFKDPAFKIPHCDQIIHLAGIVTAKKQSDYEKTNFFSTVNLYSFLKNQKWQPQRILFCSSQAAAGPAITDQPLTESDKASPVDAYGLSKFNAEKFLLSQKDIPVTVFRPCTVVGPLDTNILNLYKMAKRGFGFVPQNQNQHISFIALSDLVDVIIKLTQDSSTDHRLYFVSHNEPTDVHALWNEVAQSLGTKIKLVPVPMPLLYLAMKANTLLSNILPVPIVLDKKYYQQLQQKTWLCSSQKLQSDFNWVPHIALAQALKETAAGYKAAGWI